ncbi:MAG: leucine-rich repeat domain-containing protein, partial [Bacilli bacterium]
MLDSTGFIASVRNVFQASHRSCYNYYLTQDIIDGIQDLIDIHQGTTQESAQRQLCTVNRATNPNTLDNNLVWYNDQWSSTGGDWNSSYLNYNCYSFAIGKTNERYRYPGQHSGVSRVSNYMSLYSISQMATFVKNDLDALGGYGDVYVSSSEPNNIQFWQTLICIRKGYSDYHFMKYDKTTLAWHQKPGGTAPLKYLHHPEDMTWVSEYSSYGVCYSAEDQLALGYDLTLYDSAVYYITYGENPFTTSTSGLLSNQIAITGVKSGITLTGALMIPEELNSRTVIQISNSTFANQTQLSQISIPESVTSIGSNAFLNCTSLETVVIQREIGDITSLGSNAFLGCSSLETIEVPTKRIIDYISATNWGSYSDFMYYIDPITDGLTITSVGEESEFYLFKIEDTIIDNLKYNFYHNCTNAIEITLMDENNTILVNDIVQKSIPILVL